MNDLILLTKTSLEIQIAGKQFKLLRKLKVFSNATFRGGSLCIYMIDFFSTVCIWEIAKITKIWLFWRNYPENRKKISWRAYSSNIYLSWRKQSVSFQRKYAYWFLFKLQNLRNHKAQSRQQNCTDQYLDKIQ